MTNFRRHGDLNFHPITKAEFEALKKDAEAVKGSRIVLQEGETTGHKHVLTVPDISDMECYRLPDGAWILSIKEGTLTHEDHKQIDLAPGFYREVRERELDHFAESLERKVID